MEVTVRGLNEMAQLLNNDQGFVHASSSRERCYHACRILRDGNTDPIPYHIIGDLLGLNGGTVAKNQAKFRIQGATIKSVGRPTILAHDEYEEVVKKIVSGYEQHAPMTVNEICVMIRDRWNKEMIPDTFYHIAKKDVRLKSCAAVPMENMRLAVTEQDILTHFTSLRNVIEDAPAHFVFNMDEMGHQPWADALTMTCFVPTSHLDKTVHYPVSRIGK
jgi:hypothetical protein